MPKDVVVYTTTNCNRCFLTKRFLLTLGVPFREVSIFREQDAIQELIELTGALAAPVVIVGNRFIRGYDPDALSALLTDEGWIQVDSRPDAKDMPATDDTNEERDSN